MSKQRSRLDKLLRDVVTGLSVGFTTIGQLAKLVNKLTAFIRGSSSSEDIKKARVVKQDLLNRAKQQFGAKTVNDYRIKGEKRDFIKGKTAIKNLKKNLPKVKVKKPEAKEEPDEDPQPDPEAKEQPATGALMETAGRRQIPTEPNYEVSLQNLPSGDPATTLTPPEGFVSTAAGTVFQMEEVPPQFLSDEPTRLSGGGSGGLPALSDVDHLNQNLNEVTHDPLTGAVIPQPTEAKGTPVQQQTTEEQIADTVLQHANTLVQQVDQQRARQVVEELMNPTGPRAIRMMEGDTEDLEMGLISLFGSRGFQRAPSSPQDFLLIVSDVLSANGGDIKALSRKWGKKAVATAVGGAVFKAYQQYLELNPPPAVGEVLEGKGPARDQPPPDGDGNGPPDGNGNGPPDPKAGAVVAVPGQEGPGPFRITPIDTRRTGVLRPEFINLGTDEIPDPLRTTAARLEEARDIAKFSLVKLDYDNPWLVDNLVREQFLNSGTLHDFPQKEPETFPPFDKSDEILLTDANEIFQLMRTSNDNTIGPLFEPIVLRDPLEEKPWINQENIELSGFTTDLTLFGNGNADVSKPKFKSKLI